MDLFILFGIFNEVQKCPECGDMTLCYIIVYMALLLRYAGH